MKIIIYCTKVIEYSFYALFFLVPLVFAGNTSELFEFNKMWVTFGLTIIICLVWFSKMLLQKRFFIQRTPLDIPLILFLISQIISTIFSLDTHVSIWGYYSRFNGGLLSTIAYILLYYALVSNFPGLTKYLHQNKKHNTPAEQFSQDAYSASETPAMPIVKRILGISLVSGLIVALWGLPSHFGYDPTCFVFRGSFDTSCWTNAFKPTIRAFSTIGQPDWFAAYLAVLIPLAMAFAMKQLDTGVSDSTSSKIYQAADKRHGVYIASVGFRFWVYFLLAALFYLDLIFASAKAGFIAFWVANIIFWLLVFWKKIFSINSLLRYCFIFNITFLVLTFIFGSPIDQLNTVTIPHLVAHTSQTKNPLPPPQQTQTATTIDDNSITDSGKIRLYVWQGAIAAWEAHPLFGTGVETFAFAYYQYRPKGHNMTSEWDYLYNKAHNEYLNYLATTGIFGLGSYLIIIGVFLFVIGKWLIGNKSWHQPNGNQATSNSPSYATHFLLTIALVTGWFSILITNFFGFSVVIMNLFLFLIPAFVFLYNTQLNPEKKLAFPPNQSTPQSVNPTPLQWTGIGIFVIIACYLLLQLLNYWYADVAYALGVNLDHVNEFQQAYPQLQQAVTAEPNEPVYLDEFALNQAALAAIFYQEKQPNQAGQLAKNAIAASNQVLTEHPNDVVYWKDRVRVLYTIAQGDTAHQAEYYAAALQAIEKASQLAPTDAKTWYNLGILYGQTGSVRQAIQVLQHTVYLKPDYRDAYFALGLFYHQLAVDKTGKVTNPAMQQKAVQTYQYILKHIAPNDPEVEKSLNSWQE